VIVEINNECNVRYDHAILQPSRVHELIERWPLGRLAKLVIPATPLMAASRRRNGSAENVVQTSDFLYPWRVSTRTRLPTWSARPAKSAGHVLPIYLMRTII
jgi:hypothetical protein